MVRDGNSIGICVDATCSPEADQRLCQTLQTLREIGPAGIPSGAKHRREAGSKALPQVFALFLSPNYLDFIIYATISLRGTVTISCSLPKSVRSRLCVPTWSLRLWQNWSSNLFALTQTGSGSSCPSTQLTVHVQQSFWWCLLGLFLLFSSINWCKKSAQYLKFQKFEWWLLSPVLGRA